MFAPSTNTNQMMTLEECRAEELKELQSGKITIKWSQANAGYRIRAGRNAVLGLESFVSESDAWEYLKETHGINRP